MRLTKEVDRLQMQPRPGSGWVVLRHCPNRDAYVLCRKGWRWLLRILPHHAYFKPSDLRAKQAEAGFFFVGAVADVWALCLGRWFVRVQLPFLRSLSVYTGGPRRAIGLKYGIYGPMWGYGRKIVGWKTVSASRDRPIYAGKACWHRQ